MSINHLYKPLEDNFNTHATYFTGFNCWEDTQRKAATYLLANINLLDRKTESYKYTPLADHVQTYYLPYHTVTKAQMPVVVPSLHDAKTYEIFPALSSTSIHVIHGQPVLSESLTKPIGTFQVHTFKHSHMNVAIQTQLKQYFEGLSAAVTRMDAFEALNTALFQDGIIINIPENTKLQTPLCIYHICATANLIQPACHPRIWINIGKNSQVSIINSWQALNQEPTFGNAVIHFQVGESAQVTHYNLQNKAEQNTLVQHIGYQQAANSVVTDYQIAWGSRLIRNNLNIHLTGESAKAYMYGLYIGSQKQHIDNHTQVFHASPQTYSNQDYKGILGHHATGVFNGRIYVASNGAKTNAFQSNRNVLLNDQATIYAKPQLEIFADDVKCSHGATVGQLNENHLFYLRSRGLPLSVAKKMLLQAFSHEVIATIPCQLMQAYIKEDFDCKLETLM